jgi:hypothetical protein
MPHRCSSVSLRIAILAGLSMIAGQAFASSNGTPDLVRSVLRMTEFFDTTLPGTLEEHNMTLHFTPKFNDLRRQEYFRLPIELRYGFRRNIELSGGLIPFGANPFNKGRNHRWGPGEAKLGMRYDLGRKVQFFDDTTVGLETRVPLGNPPVELNDHYTHVKPFVSAARTLLAWPSTTFYANVSYDRSVKLTGRSAPPPEVTRRHIIEVSPGLLFKPAEFGYFIEYRWRHISEPLGSRLANEIQFGTIWDVPVTRSEKWRLPGKWQLELAYRFSHEQERGNDHGFAARVNWRTTLREVLARTTGSNGKGP